MTCCVSSQKISSLPLQHHNGKARILGVKHTHFVFSFCSSSFWVEVFFCVYRHLVSIEVIASGVTLKDAGGVYVRTQTTQCGGFNTQARNLQGKRTKSSDLRDRPSVCSTSLWYDCSRTVIHADLQDSLTRRRWSTGRVFLPSYVLFFLPPAFRVTASLRELIRVE